MKRVFSVLFVSFLILAGTTLPASATDQTVLEKIRFQGNFALASFTSVDPMDDCVTRNVEVFANAASLRTRTTPKEDSKFGEVSISVVNTCTGDVLVDGFGETTNIDLNSNQSRGHLVADLSFKNVVDGSTSHVHIDLDFHATGQEVTEKAETEEPGLRTRFVLRERDATATGSVLMDDVNLTPVPSDSGTLGLVKQRFIERTP